MTDRADQAGGGAEDCARAALEAYDDLFGPYPWRRLVVAPTTSLLGGDEYPGIALHRACLARRPGIVGAPGAPARPARPLVRPALRRQPRGRPPVVLRASSAATSSASRGSTRGSPSSPPTTSSGRTCSPPAPCGRSRRPSPTSRTAARRVAASGTPRRSTGAVRHWSTSVRRLLGDKDFFAAMRGYVRANRFGIATADDLIGAWRERAWSPLLLDALPRAPPRSGLDTP